MKTTMVPLSKKELRQLRKEASRDGRRVSDSISDAAYGLILSRRAFKAGWRANGRKSGLSEFRAWREFWTADKL